jgi:hypothetical protein
MVPRLGTRHVHSGGQRNDTAVEPMIFMFSHDAAMKSVMIFRQSAVDHQR